MPSGLPRKAIEHLHIDDGNKRIAFIASITFARLHGWRIVADQAEVAAVMPHVAVGKTGRDGCAAWMRDHAHGN